MDSLPAPGPINSSSYFFGDHLNVINYLQQEEAEQIFIPTSILDDKMPFLEMLQSSVESQSPQFLPFKDSNFETLVRLHNMEKKPCEEEDKNVYIHAPPEPESCVTTVHDVAAAEEEGMPSPRPEISEIVRKKRKRTRGVKNREEVENQRMTHIAIERNRRRQMNDHLGVLRSLMPTSYIQRGDQASIIGGAIDFLKELEQLVESLEAERMRRKEEGGLLLLRDETTSSYGEELGRFREEVRAEKKTEEAEIEVTVIERHVNLKVECKRKAGQLVKAIFGLEDLRLTILHLNITSSHSKVLYSFNLKIEEECKLVSASEIAGAVQEIFMFINGS